MSTASIADWLEAIKRTPATPAKTPGVAAKSAAVIGGNDQTDTATPGTPKNRQGQEKNTEIMETGAAVQEWAPQPAPATAPLPPPQPPAQAKPPAPAPAPDPGHAALLALAMAYCDRTCASDKARSDWARDVQDTPPELRGDLYAHLREQLPPVQPRPVPAPAPAPAPAKPATWLDVAQPWRVADAAYLAHWGQCRACHSATRHGERCPTGQQLHDAYAQAVRLTH